jgi:cell division protein FtsN
VPAAGAPPRYTVQVGAFSEAERAVALQREIARLYPEAVVDHDGTWNRVQIGAFDRRESAESLRRELAVIGLSSVVVSAK